MKTFRNVLLASALIATCASAQTQMVRGDIDGIRGTNRFRLDCTNIELVSATVNLQQLHDLSRQRDIEFEMQVRNVSAGGRTVLDVVSATQIPEMFDMGNVRLGRSDTWEAFYTPGSAVGMFVTAEALTSYGPLGAAGTWLLGPTFLPIAFGTTNFAGRFQIDFQPPNNPSFIGANLTAQALILDPNNVLVITNPDCKDVRN